MLHGSAVCGYTSGGSAPRQNVTGHQSDSCDGRGASVETGDVLLSILKAGYIIYIHPVVLTQHP